MGRPDGTADSLAIIHLAQAAGMADGTGEGAEAVGEEPMLCILVMGGRGKAGASKGRLCNP